MTDARRNEPTSALLGATQGAIEHHYDIGDDFYRLWLDPTLTYSCAMYSHEKMSLTEAQIAKLEYWLRGLRLSSGNRLLDIGCGWGGLLRTAVRQIPNLQVLGLTLSSAQATLIREMGLPVELASWDSHEPREKYDAIVSLGAFEHFARTGLSRGDRIVRYRHFFERCFSWLPAAGRLGLQTSALDAHHERVDTRLGRYFTEDVFPESSLPRLAEIIEASDEYFRLVALRVDPTDYVRTCRDWRRRLYQAKTAAIDLVGLETVNRYRKMLFLAEREFLAGYVTLYRFGFERRNLPVSASGQE